MPARERRTGRIALAVHGGAGTISRARMTPRREAQYRAGLEYALNAGYEVLKKGGSSVDAVLAAVVALEDDPLFNAGRGAVFNQARKHELDAAIMDGVSLHAGAVAAITRAKNPIRVARAVMDKSRHVLLAGSGADAFARRQRLKMVKPDYFSTLPRRIALEREQLRDRGALAEKASAAEQHGTVGAVACDLGGNVAAGTSTGGMTNKMVGRVGDSPVIGAGTYADNRTCAVSATGEGEFFIRAVLAYDVTARMRYSHESLAVAARGALAAVARLGGTGGLIAVDTRARVAMPFNTEGMYRGCIRADGRLEVAIFREHHHSKSARGQFALITA